MDDVRKKIFVIDTSVLIEDPDVLFKLGGNEIVIPTAVLKELDGLKKHPDPDEHRAKAARQVTRTLDMLGSYQDISTGARTSAGSIVRIYNQYHVIDDLASSADNRIVGTAIKLKEEGIGRVILVSTDGNMRNVTRSYKIKAENYPFSLGDSVDRPKARLLEEWNSTDVYVPRIPKVAPHKIALNNPYKFRSTRKRWIAAVILTIILYYLITNIR
ncbi:MAG: PIN domain-containing protein [Thermodesulfovibrionales bacterium]|nr:PIN domain-containing protein [Thermodesulfovibrionales bacterium]